MLREVDRLADPVLAAVVEIVAERGVASASVELVIARAGVSHRAFYQRFDGLDECIVAVMDGVLADLTGVVTQSFEREGSWLDGMRASLAAMLEFFDAEPARARVCLVEAMGCGPVVREYRGRVFEALRVLLVERIEVQEVERVPPLVREGVMASVMGIVSTRLVMYERAPLLELLGPLMGIVVEPFMSEAQVAREVELGNELAQELLSGSRKKGEGSPGWSGRPGRPGRCGRPRRCGGRDGDVRAPVVRLDSGPGEVSVRDARAGVVARLRTRRDELVREIFARVRVGGLAEPGGEGAEYVEGLRAAVEAAVDYVLAGIERGEDRAGPMPLVASEQARRAARAGVPLNTVLRRYIVGHTLFEQFVMDEADRGGEHGLAPVERESLRVALREALRAQAVVLDRLLERVGEAYGDELEQMGRSPEQRRAERVLKLLEGGAFEDRAVAGYAVDATGREYEIGDRWHLGVIAVGDGAALAVRSLAGRVDRRLLSVERGEQTVWAWLGGRERFAVDEMERAIVGVGAMGSSPPEGGVVGMGSHSPGGVVLALGEPGSGIEGWRSTHRQAQAALTVALRRRESGSAATRYADVALLAAALKDEMLGRALLDTYIAPLQDARGAGRMLRETLRAYIAAEHSVSSTAAALGVARKTVASRLRTIEGRLGRSLHPCPAALEVALLLDELDSAPVPAVGPAGA